MIPSICKSHIDNRINNNIEFMHDDGLAVEKANQKTKAANLINLNTLLPFWVTFLASGRLNPSALTFLIDMSPLNQAGAARLIK